MSERITLQKPGFHPLVIRRADPRFYDGWEMLRYRDAYGEEHWQNIPHDIDMEGAITEYRVDKPMTVFDSHPVYVQTVLCFA